MHALAHITGGGVPGNLPRVIGPGAVVQRDSWELPPVFGVLQHSGSLTLEEMDRVFNMGVGMIAIVPPDHADDMVASLRSAGETAWLMGEIEAGHGVRYG